MRIKTLLLFSLWLVSTGCNQENSLKLSLPDGNQLEYGGSISIIAEIKEQGQSPEDDSEILFSTSVGSFEPFQHGVISPVQTIEVGTIGGRVEVTLYDFPGEGGTGQVTASYETINGITVSGKATIMASGGGKASGAAMSAFCDPLNVAAFADQAERASMRIRCVVLVKNIRGDPIPKAEVRTMVESGCGIQPVPDTSTTDFIFTLSPICEPQDVEPLAGEPNHVDQGLIRNPRDGLLTLVFYTEGEEGYVDTNANGQHDEGEPFPGHDLAEPFVDANDNGQYDPTEPFEDVDNNGEWSPANGVWDADTKIWVATHVMFTGRPHEGIDTSRFDPTGININNAGSQTLTLHLVDANHNPLASHGTSDAIEFTVQGARIVDGESLSLDKTMGVEFSADGILDVQSFLRNRSYQVTLEDEVPDPESTSSMVTLRTTVNWTAAPDFEDYSASTFSSDLGDVTGLSD